MRRKLQKPILPYECKCQCNKVYDIYGDHPFHCQKNHKGHPHNIITHRFSQALASLLTTANIISPTTNLDKETHLHLPSDPTASPFDASYKPNIECHPSNVFSIIGYDIAITNVTTPLPLPTNQDPPSSLDCITNYTANADLSLQYHELNKLDRPNNRRTIPPISGDDIIVIGNLLHNQMILTPIAIDGHGRIGLMLRQNLYGTPPPPILSQKQFIPNRPNAKAMYERATTLPAPIGISSKQINDGNGQTSTTKTQHFMDSVL